MNRAAWIATLSALFLSVPVALAAEPPDVPAPLHLYLVGSAPADGDTLAESPAILRLEFSQPVDPALGQVRIEAADGTMLTLEVRAEVTDDRVLVVNPPSLSRGEYRVHWRVVADDGHPVTGDFAFFVDGSLPPPEAAVAPVTQDSGAQEAQTGVEDAQAQERWERVEEDEAAESSNRWLSLLRGLGTGLLLALAGLLAFEVWLLPGTSTRVRRLAVALAILAPIVLAAHLIAWLGYIVPPGETLDFGWAGLGLSTSTGRFEMLRLICVVLALATLVALDMPAMGALLAMTGLVVTAGIGHGSDGSFWSITAKAIHLLAVAFWAGGLLQLLLGRREGAEFRATADRVSSVALGAVVAVTATGLWQSIDLLPSFRDLFVTAYGRMLLAKVAGLGILIAFGARNRFRIMPAMEGTGGEEAGDAEAAARAPAALRRSVLLETVVMVVVILLAGFLAYLPLPEAAVAAAATGLP
jgi:copper transport protein